LKGIVLAVILGGYLVAGAFVQTEAVPEFEAVSIKAAPPPTGMGIRVMMRGGPGSDDPGRLDWNNVSLRQMITNAFNMKDYQVQGPDWLNTERFDVVAKVPQGTTKEQFRLMTQKMLADRFKMTFHHESKEHAVYALTVAKGGPKLTSGFAPMAMRGGDGVMRSAAAPPPPPPPGGVGRGGPDAGPGRGAPGRGGMMMMGPGRLQAKKMGVEGLANMLSNITGKPVIDQTELKGIYDFNLEYAPETGEGSMMMGGIPASASPGAGGGEGRGAVAMEPGSGLNIYAAVQKDLGLKLEPKKLPLDNVIIDHMEKVPSEN
jgi:uncharacterized protein (TIGR03435 family)